MDLNNIINFLILDSIASTLFLVAYQIVGVIEGAFDIHFSFKAGNKKISFIKTMKIKLSGASVLPGIIFFSIAWFLTSLLLIFRNINLLNVFRTNPGCPKESFGALI